MIVSFRTDVGFHRFNVGYFFPNFYRARYNLCRFFGFHNRARHRAAGDALVTAELLSRLLMLAREEGARTLQDLSIIESRRRQYRRRRRRAMPTEPREDSCPEELQ